jgi:hypothetical protein
MSVKNGLDRGLTPQSFRGYIKCKSGMLDETTSETHPGRKRNAFVLFNSRDKFKTLAKYLMFTFHTFTEQRYFLYCNKNTLCNAPYLSKFFLVGAFFVSTLFRSNARGII